MRNAIVIACFVGLLTAIGPAAAKDDPMAEAYMAGYRLLEQKDYAAAREQFQAALATAPKVWQQGACHYRIAECFEAESEFAKAVEHYVQAVRSQRQDRYADNLGRQRYIQDAMARLADVAPRAGQSEVVGECATWLLGAFPNLRPNDRVQAYEQATAALAKADRVADAVAYVEARVAADKYLNPEAVGKLQMAAAEALARDRQYEAAEARYAAAAAIPGLPPKLLVVAQLARGELLIERLERYERGREMLLPLLAQVTGRDRGKVRLAIARSYVTEGKLEQARAAFGEALADPAVHPNERRRAVEDLAKLLAQKDQYDGAREMLQRFGDDPATDPGERQHYLRVLFDLAWRAGDLDTALDATDRLLKLRHERPEVTASWHRDALRRRADVLWRQDQRAEALAALRQGIATEPSDRNQGNDLRLRLGNWLSEQGQQTEARKQLTIVKDDAAAHPHHRVRAVVYLNDSYRRNKELEEGRKVLQWGLGKLNSDPDQTADMRWRLAENYREADQPEPALEHLDGLLKMDDINPEYHRRAADRGAELLGRQKKFAEGCAMIDRTLARAKLNKGQRSSLLHRRFRLEQEAGDTAQARETAQAIIDLGATSRDVKDARDWLEKQDR